MTSRDEALRALEKKLRAESVRRDESAFEMENDDPESAAWNRGVSAGMDECADELAAILSARQEVAPVAEYQVRPRGWTEESGWRKVTKREFDDHGPFPGYPDSEWERRCLCTSPAQTSEARDAVDVEAIEEAYETLENLVSALELRMPDRLHVEGLRAALPEVTQKIRAAMRQEGGK